MKRAGHRIQDTGFSKGFSLLEIMVATAILAIALVAIMTFQANTLRTSRRAELMTVATMLARERMMEIELEIQKGMRKNEFPEERSETGRFDDPFQDFEWRYEIKRVDLPPPTAGGDDASLQAQIGKQLTQEIAKSVREIKLTVAWDEDGEEQTIDVATHVVKL